MQGEGVTALILDTSGLLAAIDAARRLHAAAREALEGAGGTFLLSPFVLTEIDHLLATAVGVDAELALLDEASRGTYRFEAFSTSDVAEAKSAVEQHADFGDVGLAGLQRRTRPAPWHERHTHARRAPLSHATRTAGSTVPPAPRRPLALS